MPWLRMPALCVAWYLGDSSRLSTGGCQGRLKWWRCLLGHVCAHSVIKSSAVCNLLTSIYLHVVSKNLNIDADTIYIASNSTRSFKNIKNNNGPMTLPWIMPLNIHANMLDVNCSSLHDALCVCDVNIIMKFVLVVIFISPPQYWYWRNKFLNTRSSKHKNKDEF